MSNRLRILMVVLTVLVCIGADQITKEMVRSHLSRTKSFAVAGGMVKLDYNENKGAEFSFE